MRNLRLSQNILEFGNEKISGASVNPGRSIENEISQKFRAKVRSFVICAIFGEILKQKFVN